MNMEEINFTEVTPKNIWNFKQNKISLMVDLITNKYQNVDPDFLYEVALKTGIFKWFAVRRQLIKLKNKLRSIDRIMNVGKKSPYQKGCHRMLIEIKEEIRKLCHSDRWQCPDHDRRANEWLKNKEIEYFARIL